jgi:hypothetical protein
VSDTKIAGPGTPHSGDPLVTMAEHGKGRQVTKEKGKYLEGRKTTIDP